MAEGGQGGVCPTTGLTAEEREHLVNAWKKMIGTTPREFKSAGINLVLWMFDNVPNMRGRFTKFSGGSSKAALVADEMFLAHTQAVIIALDATIKLLDNPPKLGQKLTGLVRSHVNQTPPIGTEYFQPFAEKFDIFMTSALSLPADHPEVKAWVKFLFALCEVVKNEENNNLKTKTVQPGGGGGGGAKSGGGCCILS